MSSWILSPQLCWTKEKVSLMQYKQGWHRTTGLLIFMFLLDKVSTWFHVMKQQRRFTFLEHVDASGQAWAEQEWPPKDGTNRKKQKCVQVCRSPSADPISLEYGRIRAFVVLVGKVPRLLMEGRVCSCSDSKRGDRIAIPMRQHHLLSTWSSGFLGEGVCWAN